MIIDGIRIANEIKDSIRSKISSIEGRKPCLAVILVGEHPASHLYVQRKTEACLLVGIQSIRRQLVDSISEEDLINEIEILNQNPEVDGILIQLPLPAHMNPIKIMHCIHPDKDVDGFHPINVGKMLMGEKDGFFPCTPLGIQVLLEKCEIEVSGKNALVIGRSNIVGKPMAALLMQNGKGGNATVTVAHRYSKNLKELCLMADIIIAAVGQPKCITADMVKRGAVVIDVGINKVTNAKRKSGYEIVGDVDFDQVKELCSYITPVPGGVGPMTIAMLMQNTLLSFERRITT